MNTIAPTDSFVRTEDFESKLDGIYLPNEAWAVFAHLETPVTVTEIARRSEMTPEAVIEAINNLLEQKLARKHLMNWREFLAQKGIAAGTSRMSPAGAQPPPARMTADPGKAAGSAAAAPRINGFAPKSTAPIAQAPTPVAPLAAIDPHPAITDKIEADESATTDAPISFSIVNEEARNNRRASAAMAISFRLSRANRAPAAAARVSTQARPTPATAQPRIAPAVRVAPAEPAPEIPVPVAVAAPVPVESEAAASGAIHGDMLIGAATKAESRRLRPILDAITRKGGGGLNGQLLVYRVFLRVPPSMMYSAGIQSLSLVDDSTTINDGNFYDVLRTAARSVASLDLDTACV